MSDKQNYYNMVAENSESTVIGQYVSNGKCLGPELTCLCLVREISIKTAGTLGYDFCVVEN